MTWFKIDDGWARHPKVRKAGRDGRALWVTAGVECAAAQTDGIVAEHLLRDYAYLADVNPARARSAAVALVSAGLWHDGDTITGCEPCRDAVELEAGAFYFHDWTVYQPEKADLVDPTERARWKRRKALSRDGELTAMICARDRNLCRYCGQRVNWKARRGALSGTYDHVDPDGENTLENVVVACRRCNGRKGDRTPTEAGMVLLDVPVEPGPFLTGARTGPETGQNGHRPTAPARPRDGTGQTGAKVGPGPVLAETVVVGSSGNGSNGNGARGSVGNGTQP